MFFDVCAKKNIKAALITTAAIVTFSCGNRNAKDSNPITDRPATNDPAFDPQTNGQDSLAVQFSTQLGQANSAYIGAVHLAEIRFLESRDQNLSKLLATSRDVTLQSSLDGGKVTVEFYNDNIINDGNRAENAIKSLKIPAGQANISFYFSILSAESKDFSLSATIADFEKIESNRTPIEPTVFKYSSLKPAEEWKVLDCVDVQAGDYLVNGNTSYFTGSPREIFAKFGGANGVPASVWALGAQGYDDCSESLASNGRILFAAGQGVAVLKIKKPQNASGPLNFYLAGASGLFEIKSQFVSTAESTPSAAQTVAPTAGRKLLTSVQDIEVGPTR